MKKTGKSKRKRLWACWAAVFAAAIGVFWVGTATAETIDRIVAVVNEDIITLTDLNKAFQPYLERVRAMNSPLEKQRKMLFEAREQVLEQLINQKLTDQQIEKEGIKISEKEVDAAIERIKSVNFYTEEAMRNALQQQGVDYSAYRDTIKEQLLRSKLVNLEVNSKIVITQQDIEAYYNAHADQYAGEKKLHLRNIIKRAGATASEKEAIRREMETVLAALQNGASFSETAKKHSEAPTKSDGGYLGVFSLDDLSPEIRDAVKGLKQGQFSEIVDTDYGYQIFYVDKVVETSGTSVEKASAEIQQKLYQEIEDKKFNEWIENLRKQSHIKIIQ